VSEVDRAVGLHYDIVWSVERLALEAACQHGGAAVWFLPGDPARQCLARDQPALRIACDPVRPVGVLLEDRNRLAGGIFPSPLVSAPKQQVAALLPPQRALDICGSSKIRGDIHDRLRRNDDLVQRRIELVDALNALCRRVAIAAATDKSSCSRR